MTGNAKKFLEAASKDEAIRKDLTDVKDVKDFVKVANAHGFKLTAEDFSGSKMDQISEDEMRAVAGGAMQAITSMCKCTGGYGFGLTNELNCECQQKGGGFNTTIHDGDTHQRCWCASGEGIGFA